MKVCISLICILAIACTSICSAQKLSVSAGGPGVIKIDAPASSGLKCIYVVDNCNEATIEYSTSNGTANVSWMSFDNRGSAYAENVDTTIGSGGTLTLSDVKPDCGYIISDGARQLAFWVVDYSRHRFEIKSASISDQTDCQSTILDFEGEASPINYYSTTGRRLELSREISVKYTTLVNVEGKFEMQTVERTLPSITSEIRVDAPLCETTFTISGDRFKAQWGETDEYVTAAYASTAVDAITSIETVENDASNQQEGATSGPLKINLTAETNDAAVFKEWQISSDPEFDAIIDRIQSQTDTYTLADTGKYFIRFVAANADASCSYTSETYELEIGESSIKCPNAFTPNNDGVNDEWKVSYRSIIDFECVIFNRWGTRIATLTHPSQGWDGKYRNSPVPSGTYYYVIKARGADGRQYNLSGDINILKSKNQ